MKLTKSEKQVVADLKNGLVIKWGGGRTYEVHDHRRNWPRNVVRTVRRETLWNLVDKGMLRDVGCVISEESLLPDAQEAKA